MLEENIKRFKVLDEKLKLNSKPVAVKLLDSIDDVPEGIELIDKSERHCEMIRDASRGEMFYSTEKEQTCKGGAGALGIIDVPESVKSGKMYYNLGRFNDIETAKKIVEKLHVVDKRHEAIVYAPLDKADFEADVIVMLLEPKDAMHITQSIVFTTGEKVKPSFAGIQSLCGDVFAGPYNSKKYNISLGCDGSRGYAELKDTELAVGVSIEKIDDIIENLKKI